MTTDDLIRSAWLRMEIPSERIAKAIGITRQGLSYRAKRMGLPSRAGNQASNKKGDDDLFRRMWQFGVHTGDMAEHFGYAHPSGVSIRRRMMGLPGRSKGFRWCRITEFWDAEMARMMAATAPKRRAG